jgi:hypothetical protein
VQAVSWELSNFQLWFYLKKVNPVLT